MSDLLGVLALLAVGFAVLAGISLKQRAWPATPSFARPRSSGAITELRVDANAGFFTDRGFLFRKRHFFVGTGCPPVLVTDFRSLDRARLERPVRVARRGRRTWWWFEDGFYRESVGYRDQDVLALVRERERRQRAKLERAHLLLSVERDPKRRERIPSEVRRAVFERDGGRCVRCGTSFDIQYDHVIPVSLGGSSTVENLQILCGTCNRVKGSGL